jgi:hypothetical protein
VAVHERNHWLWVEEQAQEMDRPDGIPLGERDPGLSRDLMAIDCRLGQSLLPWWVGVGRAQPTAKQTSERLPHVAPVTLPPLRFVGIPHPPHVPAVLG